jgi:hypothetical protein
VRRGTDTGIAVTQITSTVQQYSMHSVDNRKIPQGRNSTTSTLDSEKKSPSAIRVFANRRALAKIAIAEIGKYTNVSEATKRTLFIGFEQGNIDLRDVDENAITRVSHKMWADLADCTLPKDGSKPKVLLPDLPLGTNDARRIPADLRAAIEAGLVIHQESAGVNFPKEPIASDIDAEPSRHQNELQTWSAPHIDQLGAKGLELRDKIISIAQNLRDDTAPGVPQIIGSSSVTLSGDQIGFELRAKSLPPHGVAQPVQEAHRNADDLKDFHRIILETTGILSFFKTYQHCIEKPWHIVMESDCTFGRKTSDNKYHKDGGPAHRALFTVLIYLNESPMVSPEWIADSYLNPDKLSLPSEVKADLLGTASMSDGHMVDCAMIQPGAVFSFLDPVLYHATPFLHHRADITHLSSKDAKETIIRNMDKEDPGQGAKFYLWAEKESAAQRMMMSSFALSPLAKTAEILSSSDHVHLADLIETGISPKLLSGLEYAGIQSNPMKEFPLPYGLPYGNPPSTTEQKSIPARHLTRKLSEMLDTMKLDTNQSKRPPFITTLVYLTQEE